jgi:uncharacterized membrane protein YfcA
LENIHTWLSTPSFFEFSLFLISIVAGIFGAVLGLGGGIVIVPALTLLFGVNIRYAIGASIVSVIATSSGAAAAYVRDHITNIRVAMLLEIATTIGALAGAVLAPYVPQRILFFLFALIMLFSAGAMFRKRGEERPLTHTDDGWANRLRLNSSYPDQALGRTVDYAVTRVPLGFTLMLGAGVISALLGVGSGSLKVPAMDSAMKLPIKVSSATSNFMIGVTAAASAGAYYMRGEILPFLVAPVAIGVLLGSILGARIMMKLSGGMIRKCFLAILLLVAFEMMLKAFGAGSRI